MSNKQTLKKPPVDDAEFLRLHLAYTQRREHSRRSPERVERPIDIKPSVAGARIVNWEQYLELVAAGGTQYPPTSYGARKP